MTIPVTMRMVMILVFLNVPIGMKIDCSTWAAGYGVWAGMAERG